MCHGVAYKGLGLVHTYQLQSNAQVLCDSRPAAHEGAQDQLQAPKNLNPTTLDQPCLKNELVDNEVVNVPWGVCKGLGLVHTYQLQSTAQPTKGPRTSCREMLTIPQLCTKAPKSDGINKLIYHPPAVHEGTQERWQEWPYAR